MKNKSVKWSENLKSEIIKSDFDSLLLVADNNICLNKKTYENVKKGEHLTSNRYQWRTSKRNNSHLTYIDSKCVDYCKKINSLNKYYDIERIRRRKVKRFISLSLSELLEMYLQVGKKEFRTISKMKKAIRKKWLLVYQDEKTREYFLIENYPVEK